MAIVRNNIVTTGISGKIDQLVFRRRGNKTTVYALSPRKKPLSGLQKEAQHDFAKAVSLAKQELAIESRRRWFEELAKKEKKASAYGAAVSYYYKLVRAGDH